MFSLRGTRRQVGSFPLCLLFYPGKYKCKMVPFNKGSHLSILRRKGEGEQDGRCISCFHLNGNLNGCRTVPHVLAIVQSCLL